jgi:hypothetical protein
VLEEAKRILIAKQHISENAAYDLIRSKAMSERIPIEDIAKGIIQSEKFMTKIFCETPIQDCYSSYRKILKSEFIIFYLIRLFAYSELQSEEMGI